MFERFESLLRGILPQHLREVAITPATHLTQELGLSSLELLRLLIACDREFSVDLAASEADLTALLVVGDALQLIERIGGA